MRGEAARGALSLEWVPLRVEREDKVERLSKRIKWQQQREGRPMGPNEYWDPSCGGAARASRSGVEEQVRQSRVMPAPRGWGGGEFHISGGCGSGEEGAARRGGGLVARRKGGGLGPNAFKCARGCGSWTRRRSAQAARRAGARLESSAVDAPEREREMCASTWRVSGTGQGVCLRECPSALRVGSLSIMLKVVSKAVPGPAWSGAVG
jgi:hypothetical protein